VENHRTRRHVTPFAWRLFYSLIMRISVDMQLQGIVGGLRDLDTNQIPFALATALNETVKDIKQDEEKEIRDSIDRPTSTTLDAIYWLPATKQKLQAEVGIKNFAGKGNPASKYLAAQIEGGPRGAKRFERALQAAGILPPDFMVVPGSGVPLDQYGNISPSLIVQLLSYFKAFPEMGYKANMTDKKKAALAKGNKKGKQGVSYFVARDGWLHPGVWARYSLAHGSAVKPVLMFVRSVNYEKRFDFFYTAELTVKRRFEGHMRAAWAKAWATARRS
jgi:hypothetical protein